MQMNKGENDTDRSQENIKNGAGQVDTGAVEKELKTASSEKNTRVFKGENFIQVESAEGDEKGRRAAIVEINRAKSLEHWDIVNQKKEYRGTRDGGKDKVSFSVKTDDGRTVELNLQQIRAMEKMLKADVQGAEDEQKAA